MFDIGFSELAIIGLVALIVIGPEELPRVARTVGHLLGRLRRYVSDVKSDISREMDLAEFKRMHQDVTDAARDMQQSIHDEARAFERDVNDAVNALRSPLHADDHPAAPEELYLAPPEAPMTEPVLAGDEPLAREPEPIKDENQLDLFAVPAATTKQDA